jgi:pyridoxine 5-phosphate synthase
MRLYINVDHVATVRQARRAVEPDPLEAAELCERAGADGITVHLREDRRHIQDGDVHRLAAAVRTVLNLELATAPDIVGLAVALRPHQATFVPERRAEITTEGGLQLGADSSRDRVLAEAVARVRDAGVRVSLFVDPDPRVLDLSAAVGAHAVELHTGAYSHAFPNAEAQLERLAAAARHAKAAGLAVHAGHGLTRANVPAVVRIPEIEELNIGHTIVSRAIMVGMERAVAEMRAVVDAARVDQPSAGP